MLMARRVVRTKAELTLVRVARYSAWTGSLTAASLVTPPPGELPFGRVCDVIDSLRVTRLHRNGGGVMSTRKTSVKTVGRTGRGRERLPAELSQANLNASGIDVGASSHFAAVSQDRSEQPVREFAAYTADLYRLADWLAEWRPWSWNPPGCTGYRCSGCWKSGDLR